MPDFYEKTDAPIVTGEKTNYDARYCYLHKLKQAIHSLCVVPLGLTLFGRFTRH